jgi:signal transduction histidine kinase
MKTDAHQYQPIRFVAGVLFLVIGTAFLLESFRVWRVQLVDLWPLFLVAFGTAVLLGRVRRTKVEEDRSAQLAVAEERVRIARELHDIVAHGVSLMTIQIAAARRVQQTQPEAAEQSLQAAEETGRQSLAQLQGMLSMLRGADASIGAAASPPASDWSRPSPSAQRAGYDGRRPWATWPPTPPTWPPNAPAGRTTPSPPQRRPARPNRGSRHGWGSPDGRWQGGTWPGWQGGPPWNGSRDASAQSQGQSAQGDGVRRDPPPRLADLDNLVAGMRQAGLDIATTVVGVAPTLSPGTELVIYRVIQEALTNAMRHAPSAHVQLELTYAPDHVVLFVDDDGAGASPSSPKQGGHGLTGMYERVAAAGGTVQVGPREPGPGWRVHASIPVVGALV